MIQIGEKKISPTLSAAQKNALEASLNPKLKDLSKVDIITDLKKAIQNAYVVISQKPNDPKNIVLIINELINELKNYYGTYSLAEIALAIDFGAKGKLNDLKKIPQPIISVTNILKWIDLYNELHRKNALYEQRLFEEKEAKKLTEQKIAEGNRMVEESINNTFLYYCTHLRFPDDGIMCTGLKTTWYRYLDKRNIVKIYLNLEEKRKINALIENTVPTYEKLETIEKHRLRPKGRREEWEKYRAIEVVNQCQALALEEIFKKALNLDIKHFFAH